MEEAGCILLIDSSPWRRAGHDACVGQRHGLRYAERNEFRECRRAITARPPSKGEIMDARLFKQTIICLGGALLTCSAQAQVWWPQWALNPQHTGRVSIAGQPLNNILANIVYD